MTKSIQDDISRSVAAALAEDLGSGDLTAALIDEGGSRVVSCAGSGAICPDSRAHSPELSTIAVGEGDRNASLRARYRGDRLSDPGYAQDDPGTAARTKVRRALRRWQSD